MSYFHNTNMTVDLNLSQPAIICPKILEDCLTPKIRGVPAPLATSVLCWRNIVLLCFRKHHCAIICRSSHGDCDDYRLPNVLFTNSGSAPESEVTSWTLTVVVLRQDSIPTLNNDKYRAGFKGGSKLGSYPGPPQLRGLYKNSKKNYDLRKRKNTFLVCKFY